MGAAGIQGVHELVGDGLGAGVLEVAELLVDVETDEALLEISTDKVDTEIPSPTAGTILEIRVAEDETVEVGAELAVVGSGQPSAPAAVLHDQTCGQLKRFSLTGELQKEYTLAEIRSLRQSPKADGMVNFIGQYYDVELSVESGDMDDLLFDRETQLTATVKTRPYANGKVDKIFKIFLSRPDDITSERFANQSSGTSLIDKTLANMVLASSVMPM